MKKILPLLLILLLGVEIQLHAAYLENVPVTVTQPSGEIIHCFASGDEYYNWLHDANKFTIVKNKNTGYYSYAVIADGQLVASEYVVGSVDPASVGIAPGLKVIPERARLKSATVDEKSYAPKTGDYNNIVIFIRFADQDEFAEEVSIYDEQFNGLSQSMRGYFAEVSQDQLNVVSTMYPAPAGNSIVSYQDAQVRNYYVPYDALTNPEGYATEEERTAREHTLLANAINAVKAELEGSGINFDSDQDGYIDNVCFIVQGTTEGWSELLWPHKWALYSTTVTINGSQVWEYNLQLSEVTNVSVLCHEMFHTLGAPDLYHYNTESSNLTPVGAWGLMANNTAQHMLTWMKYQYGTWFSELPTITENGTYKLPAVGNSSFACYKIPVPESTTEFFMVEYRKRTGYDTNLYYYYDEGLLVYRVNTSVTGGNRNGPPDEVYVLRPGITENAPNGSLGDATFSADNNRMLLNNTSDPLPMLTDGSGTSLSIYDVGFVGDSIEFKVGGNEVPDSVYTLTCDDVTIENGVITACTYDFSNTDIIIPDTLCGQPVTGLGYRLFRFKNVMTSVQLPSTLQTIAESAFEHNNLNSVDFSRCTNLTSIGPLAFMANNLTSMNLPENLTYLGGGVFNGNTITQINGQAFDGFIYALSDGTELISYTKETASVTIPAHVQKLGDHALNSCGLTGVDLSLCTGLTEIGFRTFFANEITSIDLSVCSNLQTIGNSGFLYSGLDTIDLSMCTSLTFIGGAAFSSNNFSSFYFPTPELSGMEFENWTDGYQNIYHGGDFTTALDVWYQANFNQSELLPLELTLTATDASCYDDYGILNIQIEGGLGGSFGVGGNNPEAENDSNSYRVTLTLNGGSSANPIVLDDSQNEISIMVEAGSYVVLVEDAAGNETENFVVIMEPEPLIMDVQVNGPICAEDSATIVWVDAFGGTEPYLYSLFRNGLFLSESEYNTFDVSNEGFYEIWVYDANGCSVVQPLFIEKPDSIAFTVKDVSCFSDSLGTAKITVENALPGQSFQVDYYYYENGMYMGSATSESFENQINISGLMFDDEINDRYYQFHVMSEMGCYSGGISKSFNSVFQELSVDFIQLNLSETSADIQVLIAGGTAPYRLEVDGVETEEYYQTISAGWHSFFVTDAHDCIVTDSLFIELDTNCPQHFHPVWEGNGVYDPMNIYIIEAQLDGVDLEPGDQIGVFDAGLCVGQGIITETITQQSILSVVVSANDGTDNGYTPGNPVVYKIWKCNPGEEISMVDAACFTNQMIPVECSDFQSGATSFVQLNGSKQIDFAVDFQPGWNIFSLPVLPNPADMEFTFSDLIAENSLLKIQDETGAAMEDLGTFGGWQNNIGDIRLSEGYKIKVNKYDSLYCSGILPDYPFGIYLNEGWNMVGFPSLGNVDALEVFQQLIDRGTLIKVQNEQGKSIEDLGIYGGWQNFIGNIWAGEGFKVKVAGSDTLWFYRSYPKSLMMVEASAPTQHFKTGITGNGVDHMNFNLVGLEKDILNVGDELAVFDGSNCVGAVVITEDHLQNQLVSLPASAADNSGMPGFTIGNNYSFRVWDAADNLENLIQPEYISGPEYFTKHESVVLSLGKSMLTLVDYLGERQNPEISCYPNPFNEFLVVKLVLKSESEVTVKVINPNGQAIRNLISRKSLGQGQHMLTWYGEHDNGARVSNGLYFIRVEINDHVYTQKVSLGN